MKWSCTTVPVHVRFLASVEDLCFFSSLLAFKLTSFFVCAIIDAANSHFCPKSFCQAHLRISTALYASQQDCNSFLEVPRLQHHRRKQRRFDAGDHENGLCRLSRDRIIVFLFLHSCLQHYENELCYHISIPPPENAPTS